MGDVLLPVARKALKIAVLPLIAHTNFVFTAVHALATFEPRARFIHERAAELRLATSVWVACDVIGATEVAIATKPRSFFTGP